MIEFSTKGQTIDSTKIKKISSDDYDIIIHPKTLYVDAN